MHSVASKIKFYFLNKLQNFGETFTFKHQLSLNEFFFSKVTMSNGTVVHDQAGDSNPEAEVPTQQWISELQQAMSLRERKMVPRVGWPSSW